MVKEKQAAFMAAYEPCHEAFIRYCSALACGKMDTEDLAQEVLLSAYQHFEKIDNKDQLLHYLVRAARNRSISQWRKSRRETETSNQNFERFAARGPAPDVGLDVQFLYQTLNQLPEKQRDAIILFEICGFTMKEIADLQNSSEGAVKTKISRGRKRLRVLMEKRMTTVLISSVLGAKSSKLFANNQGFQEEKLFEYLRQTPLETSTENVFAAIDKVLGSPLSKLHLLNSFNLNAITMSSVSVLGLAAVLFFLSPKENISTTSATSSIETPEFFSEETSEEMTSLSYISTLDVGSEPKNSASAQSENFKLISSEKALENGRQDKSVLLRPETGKSSMQELSIAAKLNTRPIPAVEYKEKASPALIGNFKTDCGEKVNFKGDIKKFKRTLLQNFRSDEIAAFQKGKIYLTFGNNGLLVNQEFIPRDLQDKYRRLLSDHNVFPCPIRIVAITDKYIAIGDIKEDGFHGRIQGSIDLNELNNIGLEEGRY